MVTVAGEARPRVHIVVHDGTPATTQVYVDGQRLSVTAVDIKIRPDKPVEATIEVDDVSLNIVAGSTALKTPPFF